MEKESVGHKILHFPLTKILIGFIICGVVAGVGQLLTSKMLEAASVEKDYRNLLAGLVMASLAITTVFLVCTCISLTNPSISFTALTD